MTDPRRESLQTIDTPDGPMAVFLAYPGTAEPAPCAILYMDVFGLREEMFDLARGFAAMGVAAAVPDLFHRRDISRFPPANGRDDTPDPAAVEAGAQTTLDMSVADTKALIDWLDGSGGAPPNGCFAIGYCMGGRHALAAAAAMPEKISGGMSVHGGRLVSDEANSPHLLIADLSVPFHFACARNDPVCPAHHIAILRNAAERSEAKVTLEELDASHGWTFPHRWSFDPTAAKKTQDKAVAMIGKAAT